MEYTTCVLSGSELVDPHREHFYGSLGNGLDPHNISYREEHIEEERVLKSKSVKINIFLQ